MKDFLPYTTGLETLSASFYDGSGNIYSVGEAPPAFVPFNVSDVGDYQVEVEEIESSGLYSVDVPQGTVYVVWKDDEVVIGQGAVAQLSAIC